MNALASYLRHLIVTFGGVIASLAGIIFKLMSSRLAAQDKIIENLQDDLDRLSKGCMIPECLWKER